MSTPVTVNELSFVQDVLKSELPVFVDVSAAWCPPCKLAAPIVAELAAQHAGKLKVVMIDGEEAAALVATLGVRGFPTFLGFKNGDLVARQSGFGGRRGLEALVATLLG